MKVASFRMRISQSVPYFHFIRFMDLICNKISISPSVLPFVTVQHSHQIWECNQNIPNTTYDCYILTKTTGLFWFCHSQIQRYQNLSLESQEVLQSPFHCSWFYHTFHLTILLILMGIKTFRELLTSNCVHFQRHIN